MPYISNSFMAVVVSALLGGASALAQSGLSPSSVSNAGTLGNGPSTHARLSADGRFVAFQSDASNLLPVDTMGETHVYVRDRSSGVTSLISLNVNPQFGPLPDGPSRAPDISADGRYVVFQSDATTLLPGDANGATDVYVLDRHTGALERVSRGLWGAEPNGASTQPAISADGRFVAFRSEASNLVGGDANGFADIFRFDRATGTTILVSVGSGGRPANGASARPSISADGGAIAFESEATNLTSESSSAVPQVFARNLQSSRTTLVSAAPAPVIRPGEAATNEDGAVNGPSRAPALSGDGRFVAFESDATNLVPGDSNGATDVFLVDLASLQRTLVSANALGALGDGPSSNPSITHDGAFVGFESDAANLVPFDENAARDAFLFSRDERSIARLSADMDDAPDRSPGGYGNVAVRGGAENPSDLTTSIGEVGPGLGGGTIFTGGTCTRSPVCDLSGMTIVEAPAGEPLAIPLRGSSACSGEQLTFTLLSPLPAGAALNPAMPFTGDRGQPVQSMLTWTPTAQQLGDHEVDFMVSDSRGRVSMCTIVLRVGGCPPPPLCIISPPGPFTIRAGQTLQFTVTGDIECPDNIVTLSTTTGLPNGATMTPPLPASGPANGPIVSSFSWRPRLDQIGVVDINYRVADLTGGMRDCPVRITVQPPLCLDDPECSFDQPSPIQAFPGDLVQFTLTGTRCPDEPLTVEALALPAGAVTDPVLPFTFAAGLPASVQVSWSPTAKNLGLSPAMFRVTDSLDRTSTCMIAVNVNPCEQTPECVGSPEGPFDVLVDETLTFQVQGSTGCPGASLTLEAITLPPGATTDPALPLMGTPDQDLSVTFRWTPNSMQTGEHEARFRVTDSTGRTADCVFQISVDLCDRAPTLVIDPPGPFVVAPGDLVAFSVTGATDCPATGLMLTSGVVPPGALLAPALPLVVGPGADAVSQFSWSPTESDVGDTTVQFTVTDTNGRSAQGSVDIRVLVPCREEEDNDTPDRSNLIDADCVYFDGKLDKTLDITCEPDTYLVLFNKDGVIINRDDNGSNKGNGWASGLFGLKRHNPPTIRPPGNGGDGIVSNGDGTFSIRLGVTGRADGLDGNLNGLFQNAPHGQLGPFRVEIFARDAAGALLNPAVLPGGAVIANPIVYTDEFITGAEAFHINGTLPIGTVTVDVCIDNSLGSVPACRDVDFFTIFNMVPLCDYCITQVAGLDCECRPTDTLVGWFDKSHELILLSDDGGPIDGYAELCLVADVNGHAIIAVTGTGDEDFDGLLDGDPFDPRAPVECPEPPPGHGVCGCYTFCIMVSAPHGAGSQIGDAPGTGGEWLGDLNRDGAVNTADLALLLGLLFEHGAR